MKPSWNVENFPRKNFNRPQIHSVSLTHTWPYTFVCTQKGKQYTLDYINELAVKLASIYYIWKFCAKHQKRHANQKKKEKKGEESDREWREKNLNVTVKKPLYFKTEHFLQIWLSDTGICIEYSSIRFRYKSWRNGNSTSKRYTEICNIGILC